MSGEFLKICSEITELYKFGTVEGKQKLINYALQNFLVEGETLHYEYKTPFNFFALGLNRNKKLPRLSWICSTLTEFRNYTCGIVCSICSLFGLTLWRSYRPSANPLDSHRGWF